MQNTIPIEQISGLILAGGRGMRMGQVNKGLQIFQGEPMVSHVLRRLSPQVSQVSINVNQDTEQYSKYLCPLIPDAIPDYAGPLAGLHAGLLLCKTTYLVTAPCDSPFLPVDLVNRLAQALWETRAQLAVAVTPEEKNGHITWQQQPVFCLVKSDLAQDLEAFLRNGGRKVSDWHAQLKVVEVRFEDTLSFRNINTRAELEQYNSSHVNLNELKPT
ncbi:molybdenum cofactor guanylyltransferase MobA [Undibacterium flavidum]|uniref:Molybdenum cofactor guanylyltransferase n=1 Tax=Undibacterium flavidum TaxID=2762297 RepID=A0ABR6YD52_9BURK|nr:molybdenum cofactor guanylyltransferase MobA [Undibacterium flavidum]MBC3874491.1 molybdenum cofactor guanylyltransferase MobA [Undibacterium flavidum]